MSIISVFYFYERTIPSQRAAKIVADNMETNGSRKGAAKKRKTKEREEAFKHFAPLVLQSFAPLREPFAPI